MKKIYKKDHEIARIVRIVKWLIDYGPEIVRIIGPVMIAVLIGINNIKWFISIGGIISIIIIIFICWSSIVLLKRKTRISNKENESYELKSMKEKMRQNYYELFKVQLAILAINILHFSSAERISVYKYESNFFIRLGRYSSDPEFIKPGREKYPDNEGCIGEAWRNGNCYINNFPDPENEKSKYLKILKEEWKINKNAACKFRMKSRSYAAFSLERNYEKIAVVVFESTKPEIPNNGKLLNLIQGSEGERIIQFIDAMKPFEPDPLYARREGF